jgi:hypothetical protein
MTAVQNFGLLLWRSMLCIDFPLVLLGISCFAALLSIAFNQFSARLPSSPARGEQSNKRTERKTNKTM